MLKDNSIIINLFMGLEFNCLIKMEILFTFIMLQTYLPVLYLGIK